MPVQLDEIDGISLGVPATGGREPGTGTNEPATATKDLIVWVRQSADLASRLIGDTRTPTTRAFTMAVTAAIQSVNALITAASAHCDLDDPPADIELRPGSSGGLVLRCYHSPSHEWKLDGTRTQ